MDANEVAKIGFKAMMDGEGDVVAGWKNKMKAEMADKFPIGALMEKGLFVASGQTHVQKYSEKLLRLILEDKLDTTFLISHRLPLEQAAYGYKIFKEEQNTVTKVVLRPGMNQVH